MKKLLPILALLPTLSFGQLNNNPEYLGSRVLTSINAQPAYTRGYTGKNSLIAIIDSGIDVNHVEFKDKILYIENFSAGKNYLDKIGHGTHVAGIAAAAKNGIGIQGVAYDAKLAIAKVTDDGNMDMPEVLKALSWANKLGADVANLSLGFMPPAYVLQPKEGIPGQYITAFTNTNTIPYLNNLPDLAKQLQGEMVLVISSGNNGQPYTAGLTQLATFTDSNRNLLLGGRVIVVGNYDANTNSINNTSNDAGHLCQSSVRGLMNNQLCVDSHYMYNYYLVAPGTRIVSSVPTSLASNGYAMMTGTSMSAPVVSGAVALIHQQWPQMKGASIVRLLLSTANKDIPFYNRLVHGQGLLDLERATRPVGIVGIPTTGRLSGPIIENIKPLIFTPSGVKINLTGVMVVDSFERDFYVKPETFVASKKSMDYKLNQSLLTYQHRNPYVLVNNVNQVVSNRINNFTYNLYYDSLQPQFSPGMLETKYHINDFTFNTGMMYENTSWLGNSLGSFTGLGNNAGSLTGYVGVGYNKMFNNTTIYGSYYAGYTNTKSSSDNITKLSNIYSSTFTLGIEQNMVRHTFGMMLYKPVTLNSATANMNVPIGLDENFNIITNSVTNLSTSVKEHRLGVYHKYNYKQLSTLIYSEYRNNYLGLSNHSDVAYGFSLKFNY